MQRSNHRLKFTNKYVEHLIFNKYVEQNILHLAM